MARRSYEPQIFTVNGRPKTLSELAAFTGVKRGTLYSRLRAGYTIDSGHALVPVNNLHHFTISPLGPSLIKVK